MELNAQAAAQALTGRTSRTCRAPEAYAGLAKFDGDTLRRRSRHGRRAM
ncbi:MAG: hypothetical protein Ct9H300mP32_7120 [Verrucomicrobiota bacterium]|nr:MAG: hypothetical protein Ct9H300mP32_7120 [Verrucomicrobiota bacterium]